MYKSSIVEIMKTFSKEELTRFEGFLKSPYHNTIANVTKLFITIKKYAPSFDSPDLENEIIWEKMFPGKKYNYGVMKNIIHELNKLGLKFITLETFERRSLAKETETIYALCLRNITKLVVQKIRETERGNIDVSNYRSGSGAVEYYYELFRISFMKNFYYRENRVEVINDREEDRSSAYLVFSFLIYMYKNYNNLLSLSHTRNYSPENNLTAIFLKEISPAVIDKLLDATKKRSERDYNILRVFSNMSYAFINKESVSDYLKFKNSFFENVKLFSKIDKRDLFICLLNSVDHKSFSEIDIYKERFEITDELSKSDAFTFEKGVLYPSDFLLYIWMAFDADQFEAIEEFAGKFMNKLPPEFRTFASGISNALIQFGKGNYREVLEFISREPTESFVIKIRLRQLKVKCLYELNDFESFENEKNSVYHFLKNNKSLSEPVKKTIEDLYKRIGKLFRLREKFDQAEFGLFKEENFEYYLSKDTWFHRKIDELERIIASGK